MGARDNGGKAEPQARDEARRWALVGAYERGNMGDILLLRAPKLLLTRPGRVGCVVFLGLGEFFFP